MELNPDSHEIKVESFVEYQIGVGEYGIGKVTGYDFSTEIVTVSDVNDGSTWRGPADLATRVNYEVK